MTRVQTGPKEGLPKKAAARKRKRHTEYQFELEDLMKVEAPEQPDDYVEFWQEIYSKVESFDTRPELKDTSKDVGQWSVFDLRYKSTDGVSIGGWLLLPKSGKILRLCGKPWLWRERRS